VSTPAASQGEWQAEQEEGAKQAEQPAASQEEAQQEEALAPLSAAAEAEAERFNDSGLPATVRRAAGSRRVTCPHYFASSEVSELPGGSGAGLTN